MIDARTSIRARTEVYQSTSEASADQFSRCIADTVTSEIEVEVKRTTTDDTRQDRVLARLTWLSCRDQQSFAEVDYPFGPGRAARANHSIYECFRAAAKQYPTRTAVDDGRRQLTYDQLLYASSRLAATVVANSTANGPVGILLPQSSCCPIAILACLAANRSFVLLDPNCPADYVSKVVRDAALAALIVQEAAGNEPGLPETVVRIDVDQGTDVEDEPRQSEPDARGIADEALIVLYTSGSTGQPKGIVNSQRSVLERVRQHVTACRADERDVFMPLSPPSSIAGLRECLSALLIGASLRMLDQRRAGLRETRRAMGDSKATICYAVPTLLRALIRSSDDSSYLSTLRVMRVGGERVLTSDVALLRRALPDTCRINVAYSSTEIVGANWFVPSDLSLHEPYVPVGYMLPGAQFAIVDADGHSVPPGTVGELVVRGRHVALGHWENGGCVAGPFQPDSSDPSSRIFRTGDLVSITSSGLLTVIGRSDSQVKIRGQRVEPGELEAFLHRAPDVADSAVVVRRDGEDVALVAFVVPMSSTDAGLVGRLRTEMGRNLRPALQPALLHLIETLPRLAGGKLDKHALLEIDRSRNETFRSEQKFAGHQDQVREDVPRIVARLWNHILGRRSSALDHTWSEAGGDSLQFLRLMFELEETLGRGLLPGPFTVDMTVGEMAAAVQAALGVVGAYSPGDARTRLFLFPGVGGDEPLLFALRNDLQSRLLISTIKYPGWKTISDPRFGFSDMVAELAAQISEAAPTGPLRMVGYSYGGTVAFAVALRLRDAGREVAFLGLLDTDIASPQPLTQQGVPGLRRRVARLPIALLRANRHDTLCRNFAQYMLRPSARRLSLALLDPKSRWLSAGVRFSLDYWLCRLRRTATARGWLDALEEQGIDIPTVLFRSEEREATAHPELGWGRFIRSLHVVEVPGDHFSMLDADHRPHLVNRILDMAEVGKTISSPAALAA